MTSMKIFSTKIALQDQSWFITLDGLNIDTIAKFVYALVT